MKFDGEMSSQDISQVDCELFRDYFWVEEEEINMSL